MAYKVHEFTLTTDHQAASGEHVHSVVTFKGDSKQMLRYLKRVVKDAKADEEE